LVGLGNLMSAIRWIDYVFSFEGGASSTLIQNGDDEPVCPAW